MEETLHTDSFKLMPDGMIRLYDYLDDMEKEVVAMKNIRYTLKRYKIWVIAIIIVILAIVSLTKSKTIEDYFLSKIGGTGNVKSPES